MRRSFRPSSSGGAGDWIIQQPAGRTSGKLLKTGCPKKVGKIRPHRNAFPFQLAKLHRSDVTAVCHIHSVASVLAAENQEVHGIKSVSKGVAARQVNSCCSKKRVSDLPEVQLSSSQYMFCYVLPSQKHWRWHKPQILVSL